MRRLEDSLQETVVVYLRATLPSSAWFCAIPNGAVLAGDKRKRGMQMARMKRTGLKVGAPDIILVHEGMFYGIELKSATGRLSESQKDTADAIVKAGGFYTVCRSIDELQTYLTGHGVPLRGSLT